MKRRIVFTALALLTTACRDREVLARADSMQAAAVEQARLAQQLASQKDSLTRVVLDADAFISRIDSQVSRVKGLKTKRVAQRDLESPIEAQLEERQVMLARVKALVDRAQATATQLAASQRSVQRLKGANATLEHDLDGSRQIIADLGSTIQRQTVTIASLQARVDTLANENRALGSQNQALGKDLHEMTVARHQAYYIVGTERELLAKGVIERTGGTNLLFKKVGRSLQPARQVDPALFTAVDQRDAHDIPMPDAHKRYRIVSRQRLGEAAVADGKKGQFTGHLQITDAEQFWAPSKYLIIVQM